jgi:hypothetical protein
VFGLPGEGKATSLETVQPGYVDMGGREFSCKYPNAVEFGGYPELQLHKKQEHGTALAGMVHLIRLGTGTTAHL